jgi:hypothetical protein
MHTNISSTATFTYRDLSVRDLLTSLRNQTPICITDIPSDDEILKLTQRGIVTTLSHVDDSGNGIHVTFNIDENPVFIRTNDSRTEYTNHRVNRHELLTRINSAPSIDSIFESFATGTSILGLLIVDNEEPRRCYGAVVKIENDGPLLQVTLDDGTTGWRTAERRTRR